MSNKNHNLSFIIGILSLLLWVGSLFPTALVFYGTEKYNDSGFGILIGGWLGPFVGNFSWYANVFFIYSVVFIILKSEKSHLLSGFVAVLLALTMFSFERIPNTGGRDMLLYGYGLGSVLWLDAIALNLFANAVKEIEFRKEKHFGFKAIFDLYGVISIILILGVTVTFIRLGLNDHKLASIAEKKYLDRAIFKIGPVCEIPDIKPIRTIPLLGPLEIEEQNVGHFMFTSPSMFLSWGVPIVRKGGFDYSLSSPQDIDSICVVPAKGQSSAFLHSASSLGKIGATLVGINDSKEIVAFNAHWTEFKRSPVDYCPRLADGYNTDEPLRSLIMSSLVSANHESFKTPPKLTSQQLKGPSVNNNPTLSILSSENVGSISLVDLKSNYGCAEDTGLIYRDSLKRSEFISRTNGMELNNLTDHIFVQGDKVHLLANSTTGYFENFAICSRNSIYLLSPVPRFRGYNSTDIIHIQKLRATDFGREWKTFKDLKFNPKDLGINANENNQVKYRPISIMDNNEAMTIELAVFEESAQMGSIFKLTVR